MDKTGHLDPKLKEAYERVMGYAVGASPETKNVAEHHAKKEKEHVGVIIEPHEQPNRFKTIGIGVAVVVGLLIYTVICAKLIGVKIPYLPI